MFSNLILVLIGLSAGSIIAAGVFAFIAMIGVYPRLIGKTNTKNHIMLYETVIILGGLAGNIMYLYPFVLGIGGDLLVAIFGLGVGVFVGALVMSLAETLKAVPVVARRIHLAVGIQYLILSLGIGKMLGSLVFFAREIGTR